MIIFSISFILSSFLFFFFSFLFFSFLFFSSSFFLFYFFLFLFFFFFHAVIEPPQLFPIPYGAETRNRRFEKSTFIKKSNYQIKFDPSITTTETTFFDQEAESVDGGADVVQATPIMFSFRSHSLCSLCSLDVTSRRFVSNNHHQQATCLSSCRNLQTSQWRRFFRSSSGGQVRNDL